MRNKLNVTPWGKVYYIVNIPGVYLVWGKVYSMTPDLGQMRLTNNIYSLRVSVLLQSDTLTRFRANPSLFLLLMF
jgi:hypothetical protein